MGRWVLRIGILLLGLAGAGVGVQACVRGDPAPDWGPTSGQLTEGSLNHGGRERRFLYLAPKDDGLHPLVLALHYDFRHYRADGEELGDRWETAARLEVEMLKTRPVQVTLLPQVFFAQYAPVAESPLRDKIVFLRREDIIGMGILIGWDVTPALRLQVGSVGRRDLFRAVTSWEVTGEARWRIRPWLEGRVLYTRNTESTTVGGLEESFLGRLDILY